MQGLNSCLYCIWTGNFGPAAAGGVSKRVELQLSIAHIATFLRCDIDSAMKRKIHSTAFSQRTLLIFQGPIMRSMNYWWLFHSLRSDQHPCRRYARHSPNSATASTNRRTLKDREIGLNCPKIILTAVCNQCPNIAITRCICDMPRNRRIRDFMIEANTRFISIREADAATTRICWLFPVNERLHKAQHCSPAHVSDKYFIGNDEVSK